LKKFYNEGILNEGNKDRVNGKKKTEAQRAKGD
jgi:hypothetical protein